MSLFCSSSVNYHSNTRTTIEYNDSNYIRVDHDEDLYFTENYYFQPITNEPVVTSDVTTASDTVIVTDTRGDDQGNSIVEQDQGRCWGLRTGPNFQEEVHAETSPSWEFQRALYF